jgi:hypothetical protein
MRINRSPSRRVAVWLLLAVAGSLLVACSRDAASTQTQAATAGPAASAHPGADATPAPLGPPVPGGSSSAGDPARSVENSRGCLNVQALMSHLTADTARWSPDLDPFEPTIAARIQTLSVDLGKQVPLAETAPLQEAERANARAFAMLAAAMHGKDRGKVTEAVAGTRVAYRDLKDLCHFE